MLLFARYIHQRPGAMDIRLAADVPVDGLLKMRPGLDLDFVAGRRRISEAPNTDWFVVCDDDQPVSWVVVHWKGKMAHHRHPFLEDLFVRDDRRCQGIGSALIGFVQEQARQRDNRTLGLSVDAKENARALALYDERLGFVHDGGEPYLDGVYDGQEEWVIDMYKTW